MTAVAKDANGQASNRRPGGIANRYLGNQRRWLWDWERASMPSNASTVLNAGQTLYVTEVFYSYSPDDTDWCFS